MVIPHQRLAPETLQSLIESFVTREGTDYGYEEVSLAHKVEQVRQQIMQSEVMIVFDSSTDSINLLPRDEVCKAWEFEA